MGNPLSLVDLIVGEVSEDLLARASLGPELFGFAPFVVLDHRVGGVQNSLGRPVVLLEQNHGRVGESRLELEDVTNVGAPEPVDRLIALTHATYLAMILGKHRDDCVLDRVRVLILVDQNRAETPLVMLEHIGMAPEQLDRVEEQVIEVHGPGFAETHLVLAIHLGDLALEDRLRLLGVGLGRHVVVLGRTDRCVDGAWRELLRVEVQVSKHVPSEA